MARRADLIAAFVRHGELPVRAHPRRGLRARPDARGAAAALPQGQLHRPRGQPVPVRNATAGRRARRRPSRAARPFDLVICYDVLQYLGRREAAAALRNLAPPVSRRAALRRAHHRGLGTLLRPAPAPTATSTSGPASWYRRRLAQALHQCRERACSCAAAPRSTSGSSTRSRCRGRAAPSLSFGRLRAAGSVQCRPLRAGRPVPTDAPDTRCACWFSPLPLAASGRLRHHALLRRATASTCRPSERPPLQLPPEITPTERMQPLAIPPVDPNPAKLDPVPRCLDEPPQFFARKGAVADPAEEAVRVWAAAWAAPQAGRGDADRIRRASSRPARAAPPPSSSSAGSRSRAAVAPEAQARGTWPRPHRAPTAAWSPSCSASAKARCARN
ncbi:MAG: hypothetical protein MZV65_25895 [Chromatiales bacterium]|nr:hypothetical protein [Chromatiales bacterium]